MEPALVDHQQAYGDRALFGKGASPGMERHTCALQRALEQFRATPGWKLSGIMATRRPSA
jgi:hypothetical protein